MSDYKDYRFPTDTPAHTIDYLLTPILEILKGKEKVKILDIGCGNGWLVRSLLKNGFDAYGTDASETGIAVAKQTHPDRFFVQDITQDDLPLSLQKIPFGIIISTEVIEHLYSPRNYIQFCKRILQKAGGGEIILTTPYHGYLKNLVLSITGQMDRHHTVLWDGGHIKFWSKRTLSTLLEEAGFTVYDFIGCGRFPFLWKSMLIAAKI